MQTAVANVWAEILSVVADKPMKKKRNYAKHIAISAMLTALICVILSLGSLFETLDLSFATISSLIIWIALLEFGKKTAWGIYFPSGLISALFLPSKFPALFFICITGWYPMFKSTIQKRIKNKKLLTLIKLLVFNITAISLTAFVYFFGALLGISLGEEVTKVYIVIMLVLCNVAFIVTDILMDKLVIVYIVKIRDKLVKLKIVDKYHD